MRTLLSLQASFIQVEVLDESDEEYSDVQVSSSLLPIPIRILLTFFFVWQSCFNISDVAIGVMIAFIISLGS